MKMSSSLNQKNAIDDRHICRKTPDPPSKKIKNLVGPVVTGC
jgi:hypothetical protein